jgi:hypothetical protein
MVVLLHEIFTGGLVLIVLGWLLFAYGLSAMALYKAVTNCEFWAVLTLSLLVLLPSIFLTWILLTDGKDGFPLWLIFVAAPLFMSAAAFYRTLHVRVTRV